MGCSAEGAPRDCDRDGERCQCVEDGQRVEREGDGVKGQIDELIVSGNGGVRGTSGLPAGTTQERQRRCG